MNRNSALLPDRRRGRLADRRAGWPDRSPVLRSTAAAGAILLTLALAMCSPAAWPKRA